jgi:hypothetical protein
MRSLSVARRMRGHPVYRNFRTDRAFWEDVPLFDRAPQDGSIRAGQRLATKTCEAMSESSSAASPLLPI